LGAQILDDSIELLFKVANHLRTVVNGGLSNAYEAHCLVESLRCGIGRLDIHLTDHAPVTRLLRRAKEVLVEEPRNSLAARRSGDDHAIDVDKRIATRLEPFEVLVVIGGVSSAIRKAVPPRLTPRA